MAFLKERRLHERHEHQTEIIYSCDETSAFHNGTLSNSSRGGMYFNSGNALNYGSSVLIKMGRFCALFHAKVVRCDQINGGDKPCYGIGIKFFSPEE